MLENQLQEYENQIAELRRQRADVLEQLDAKATAHLPSGDTDKMARVNTKLKRALQSIKEKIQQLVSDRPDLFVDVGEETSERLDHLILTVRNQTALINELQMELDRTISRSTLISETSSR